MNQIEIGMQYEQLEEIFQEFVIDYLCVMNTLLKNKDYTILYRKFCKFLYIVLCKICDDFNFQIL